MKAETATQIENTDITTEIKPPYVLPKVIRVPIVSIIALTLLFIALVCFTMFARGVTTQVKANLIWPEAVAEVIAAKTANTVRYRRHSLGLKPYAEFITLKYETNNGTTVYHELQSAEHGHHSHGQKILINYNPRNPSEIIIGSTSEWSVILVFLLVGGCASVVSYIFFLALKGERKK